MAGSERFELPDQLLPVDSLANCWFKPLTQLPISIKLLGNTYFIIFIIKIRKNIIYIIIKLF